MNPSKYVVVFAFGLSVSMACGDDDGGGGSIRSLCERGCTIEASLACINDSPDTCLDECLAGTEIVPDACQSQLRVGLECAANRPASDWECDVEGEADLKAGVCAQESNALLMCFTENTEDGTCPFEEDDECDDPTGTDLCPAGTDLVDCS